MQEESVLHNDNEDHHHDRPKDVHGLRSKAPGDRVRKLVHNDEQREMILFIGT